MTGPHRRAASLPSPALSTPLGSRLANGLGREEAVARGREGPCLAHARLGAPGLLAAAVSGLGSRGLTLAPGLSPARPAFGSDFEKEKQQRNADCLAELNEAMRGRAEEWHGRPKAVGTTAGARPLCAPFNVRFKKDHGLVGRGVRRCYCPPARLRVRAEALHRIPLWFWQRSTRESWQSPPDVSL